MASEPNQIDQGIFGRVGSLFGWLGGSLAGITAMLYAFGYLVTRAHLSMLGLYGVVSFDQSDFLQEGAKFVLVLVNDFVLPVAAALLLVGLPLWWLATRSQTPIKWVRAQLAGRAALRPALFILLFLSFALLSDRAGAHFGEALRVRNLLYAVETQDELSAWRLAGNEAALAGWFTEREFEVLGTGLLATVAWWGLASSRRRGWLVAPLFLALASQCILLPMAYGATQRPVLYPRVKISGKESPSQPLFLIDSSDDAFVVWSPLTRHVTWLPVSGVDRLDLTEVSSLFVAASPMASKGERP